MAPHEQRVIDEKEELDTRAKDLCSFINFNDLFPALPVAEQERLLKQRDLMIGYSHILSERILNFKD